MAGRIEPGERLTLEIGFTASTTERVEGYLQLLSDDPDGGWNRVTRWHLLVDSEGVAPEVREAIDAGPQQHDERVYQKMEEAGASVLVFLLNDGADVSTPMSKMQALCRPIWRLLELGATGVAFPEGGTMLSAETLKHLDVEALEAGANHEAHQSQRRRRL